MKLFGALVWVALLAVVLAVGCGQGSQKEETETTGSSSTTPESQTRQETTSEEKTAGEETTGASFTAAPEMSGGSEGAADSIQGVRFESSGGYERAIIDFGSGGAPVSRVPAWSLSSPTGEGYARITFPDVEATSVSDGSFGGSLLDNFYVVRAPDGGMFVDLFATGAFQYRVTELSDLGRLAIDYRPASVELGFPLPARAERTVLFEPRVGEAVTDPLRVSGYSRNFEASNTIVLRDSNGNVLLQTTVLSNDWLDAWGYFEASLEIPAFEGQAILQVGTESPRDGSFEGVEVPITYGGGRG
ncbi:MAG: Gmad2 immunoglobulin-like domain-containing protein [Actinomycetota bacterium]|nr:Gmad2 immunoglobulin-like domain-containing protein [Actinomycetota bacterium]